MSAVIANGPQTSNQLARPLLPQVDSCTVIIFGASGDLSKRKLMSALFTSRVVTYGATSTAILTSTGEHGQTHSINTRRRLRQP